MADCGCRPHRCPRGTPRPVVRRIVHLRWKQRLEPVAIADRLGLSPSTVHAARLVQLVAVGGTGRYQMPFTTRLQGRTVSIEDQTSATLSEGDAMAATLATRGSDDVHHNLC